MPYTTLAPGGTLDLAPRVSVTGTKTYSDRSDVMMLFVRERAHVNLWSLLQAKLDPDIDLVKQSDITGDNTQQEADLQDVCDMSQSQDSARVAALTALGYKVPVAARPRRRRTAAHRHDAGRERAAGRAAPVSADKVLQPCDQLVSADGHELKQPDDLSKIIKAQQSGHRGGARHRSRRQADDRARAGGRSVDGTPIIGVDLALRFNVPLHVNIDTSDISGPSAGLAMTLAIIDALTPGDLTGGKQRRGDRHDRSAGQRRRDRRPPAEGGRGAQRAARRSSSCRVARRPTPVACKDVATARKRVGKNVEVDAGVDARPGAEGVARRGRCRRARRRPQPDPAPRIAPSA